jgi:hypothetical protein
VNTFNSPFNYPEEEPEWLAEKRIEKQREKRKNKLGREIGTWGGKRKGAGRPPWKVKPEGESIVVNMNNIQRMSLMEMGNGDISKGIQALIDQYL